MKAFLFFFFPEYLLFILWQFHTHTWYILPISRQLPDFPIQGSPPSCPVGSRLSPVPAACWNVPWSCWLTCVQVHIAAVRSQVWQPCRTQPRALPTSSPCLGSFFLFSFLCCALSSGGGGGAVTQTSPLGLRNHQSLLAL